jgi:hypothetical protein
MKTITLTEDELKVLIELLQFRIEEFTELGLHLEYGDQIDVLHSILDKVE